MANNYLHPSLGQRLDVHLNACVGAWDLSSNCRRVVVENGPEPERKGFDGIYSWNFDGANSGTIVVKDDYRIADPLTDNETQRSLMFRVARPLQNAAPFGINNNTTENSMWAWGTDLWQWTGVGGGLSATPPKSTDQWTTLFFTTAYSSFSGGSYAYWYQDNAVDPFYEISRNWSDHIAWNAIGQDTRDFYPPVMYVREMVQWDRLLTDAERIALADDWDVLLKRVPQYIPPAAPPVGPVGDGDLVQSVQEISGSGTAVSPPTRTGSGALVQSVQEIAGVGTLDAPKRGVGNLVQTDQIIAGAGLHSAIKDGDGQLIQTVQEIAGLGNIISPGTKTGGAALIQTDQVIAGVGTKVSAPRMGVGALIQSQQVIVGRGFGEGFTQPVTDQVYTLADANVYTINDAYVYT